ncbi:MAG: PEGA domain-containing protein [Chitinispirillaceae bacterium]|jgi:hypothetical protein|nr:PEGA domain-containing protein [Chitinispirillaceae bacterium]
MRAKCFLITIGLAALGACADGVDSASVPAADSMVQASDSLLSSITVITMPDSAVVLADDSIRGISPVTFPLSAGKHMLALKKKGYYLKRAEIIVDSSGPREFSYELLRPGTLVVRTEPSGAVVAIDGKREGLTPYVNDKLRPGEHHLSLTLFGYVPFERAFTVRGGIADTLAIVLENITVPKAPVVSVNPDLKKTARNGFALEIVTGLFALGAALLALFEAAQ